VAASRKLGQINSSISIEPVVVHVDHANILDLVYDADVIVDGTDNFEIRYLINDAAVKLNKPWVYGGCIGSHGQTMTIVPGHTPCLRCVFEAPPGPGEMATCETAGVLAPIVDVIASLQVAETLKLLLGRHEHINRDLLFVDVWENAFRRFHISRLQEGSCPCCRSHNFEWLDGRQGSQTLSLCGRNAIQVSPAARTRVDLDDMARRLGPEHAAMHNRFLLRFSVDEIQVTVFPDGRAIVKGTDDPDRARTLYSQYIGH
jgi:adenylyltransferase/sulfurtransferase